MAVAHVQTVKTVDNDGNTTVTTGSISVTGGNILLCAVCGADNINTPTISTVKLDGSTSFTVDKTITATIASGFTGLVGIASLPNVSGGSHTVTVTFTNNVVAATVFLTEVSGAATSTPTDGTGASTAFSIGSETTTPASGTFTTTNSDDFWYSGILTGSGSNPATLTAGTGWTIPTNGSEVNGSANQVGGVEYQANPATTSGNGQWTIDLSGSAVAAMAYKAGAVADTLMGQVVL